MPALRSSFLVFGLVAVATCGSPSTPSAQPLAFTSIVSFGFCAPALYCTSRLELSEREAVLTYESRERAPLVHRRDLQPGEWQRLVAALDAARLRALPGRIGCPDCADGGAETLTVAFADESSSSVTFEYNQDVPGIEAVQVQIRGIRQSFERPAEGPLSWNDCCSIRGPRSAGAIRSPERPAIAARPCRTCDRPRPFADAPETCFQRLTARHV